jgi:S1-C subfamily serine protease
MTAGFVATALVFGAAGVGVGLAIGQGGGANGADTLPTAAGTSPGAGSQPDVAAIAADVDQATVDLTARGPNGQDQGTGMLLTASGIVLTNNHVIAGSTEVTAQVDGEGPTYRATFLGADPTADVALLKLADGSPFHTVTLGNSGSTKVGDEVVAIGNALALSGPETVTSGTISAVGRAVSVSDAGTGADEDLKDLFQTSAAIEPGNSGGPLVNAGGQVIGMNTASANSTDGFSAPTVGFAIPINTAMSIARQIMAGKASASVVVGRRPVIGVTTETVACADGDAGATAPDCSALAYSFSGFPFGSEYGYVPPVGSGAVVTGTDQGGPAAGAGLSVGDVIVSVGGEPVHGPAQFAARLDGYKVGAKVAVGWVDQRRDRHSATLELVAGPNP